MWGGVGGVLGVDVAKGGRVAGCGANDRGSLSNIPQKLH